MIDPNTGYLIETNLNFDTFEPNSYRAHTTNRGIKYVLKAGGAHEFRETLEPVQSPALFKSDGTGVGLYLYRDEVLIEIETILINCRYSDLVRGVQDGQYQTIVSDRYKVKGDVGSLFEVEAED